MELSMLERGWWCVTAVSLSEVGLLVAVVLYGERILGWLK